jgi:hypothetical protein
MTGYIKLHRKIKSWEWYRDLNTKSVFLDLLIEANIRDAKYMGMIVPRGSLVTTIPLLGATLGMTTREVRTALSHLKVTGEIEVKTTNKFSVINVLNYEVYQGPDHAERQSSDSQATVKRQSNDSLTTRIEEEEREEREEKEKVCPSPTTESSESLTVEMAQGAGDEPVDHSKTSIPTKFATFWAAYPRKVGKGAAEKKFVSVNPDDDLLSAMLTAIDRSKRSREWKDEGGRYIPNPATWLNQRRWEDEVQIQTEGGYRDFD